MPGESSPPFCFADTTLSQRLERAEASSNAAFVDARARLHPDSGAEWREVAGAYAMFDGVVSPLTQTFGLGLFAPVADAEMETLERFFLERDAPVFHEVSPLAHPELLSMLTGRGYRPVEFTSVLYQPIGSPPAPARPRQDDVRARVVEPGEEERWAATAARGWSEFPELADFMGEFGLITAHSSGTTCFLAELDGRAIAAGALSISGGVALLAGASTVPEARNRGAQNALLQARLGYAAARGCDIALMGAQPGSASQRNAERQGFRIAYTRTKWLLGGATSASAHHDVGTDGRTHAG